MTLRSLVCLLTAVLLVGFVAPATARVDWIDYTDGYTSSCDHYGQAGDIYSMRISPPSAVEVLGLYVDLNNAGTTEIHLWPDQNGLPDTTRDLMTPVTLETGDGQQSYSVDLSDAGVIIDAGLDFHIGFVKQTDDGAFLCLDATFDAALRAKMMRSGTWQETEQDYMVLVKVDYFDEPTSFLFTDVTAKAGLAVLGSRMAWGDYDNDGQQDLLMDGRLLYRNNGNGTFTDVSTAAGISALPSNGGVWADFDNDGWLDYFAMVNSLEQYDRLLHNNGDGTFTDITTTALVEGDRDLNPTEGAAWGDYDQDGYLDLYLANYEMPGEELAIGTRDRLYHNNGDNTFTDVAPELNLDPVTAQGDYRCGRGVNWGDFNNDGWPDIYVSNYRLDPNFLYLNNGDGTFTEVAEARGVQGEQHSGSYGHTIGSDWGDFNNDGDLDLFVANLAHPQYIGFSNMSYLYLNNGADDYDFTDATAEEQIIYIETNSEPALGDWNNDGWLDVLVTNVYEGFWQQLYRNNGDGTMAEVGYYSGLNIENGWGATFVDYDNDGDLDVISNRGLFRNNGQDGHWLQVQLECSTGDPFCVGARMEVQVVWDGGTQAREVASGKGTTNGDPFIRHFGLNQCTEVWRVMVRFPNGNEVVRYRIAADQRLVISEDDPSDTEPAQPTEPGTCAEVDYSKPGWPDDDTVDDDAADDDAVDDDADDDTVTSGDDDDDDGGCGC